MYYDLKKAEYPGDLGNGIGIDTISFFDSEDRRIVYELIHTEYLGTKDRGIAIDILYSPEAKLYQAVMTIDFDGKWERYEPDNIVGWRFRDFNYVKSLALDEASRWCIDNDIKWDSDLLLIQV